MASSVEIIGAPEGMWDLPRILRNATIQDFIFCGSALLSPTAIAPATWALSWGSGNSPSVFKLAFSTDTAISWMLGVLGNQTSLANAGVTAIGRNPLAASTFSHFQAQVVAAPGPPSWIDGGYVAAGSYTDILGSRWLQYGTGDAIVLTTSMVAANCSCTMWWVEYGD